MPSIPPRVGKAASAYRVSRSAAPRGNRLICIERPRLFDGLSLSECTEVVSCAQLKCLRPKENISGHDYAVHPISLLLRGRVKTVRLNRFGVQVVLRIEEAGDLVGELVPAFGPLDRLRVQALEACQILGWADETFGTLCERFARLGRNSVQILDERLRILEERFLELATESADSRLARMLIRVLGEKRSPAGQLVKISFWYVAVHRQSTPLRLAAVRNHTATTEGGLLIGSPGPNPHRRHENVRWLPHPSQRRWVVFDRNVSARCLIRSRSRGRSLVLVLFNC